MENSIGEVYLNPNGAESQVTINVVAPTDVDSTEGSTRFVDVEFAGREDKPLRLLQKTTKGEGVRRVWRETSKYSPDAVIGKWKKLKALGVNVVPTIFISKDNKSLLMTDLTQGGKCEVWVGSRMISKIGASGPQRDHTVSTGALSWIREKRDSIFDKLVDNARKATKGGFSVYTDSWFFVRDTLTGDVDIVMGDLGQGVVQLDGLDKKGFTDLEQHNMKNIKRMSEQFNVFTESEWNSRYLR